MIHKTTRSILSVLLAALLLVTSTPLTPAFADGGGVSPQSESAESRELTKDDSDTYLIYTAENLKEFAVIVNGTDSTPADPDAHAKLMNDIDLSSVCSEEKGTWTPIGNIIDEEDPDSFGYTGTFDGDGHTISGLYIDSIANNQGLFVYVGTGGTVKDLGVSGTVSGDSYVGGVVGYNSGHVKNCYNTGSVSGNSVGGVVGDNRGTVENCYNTGAVNSSGNSVGGVVGENSGNVENCYNTGEVSGNSYVGGVVGDNTSSVTNCYNTGTVTGTDDYVGGVVGYNSSSTVENCYNTGKVTGTDDYVGGVVGDNGGTVENCYNTGAVNSSGNSSVVGGVVGYNSGPVKNCYNTGTVTGTDDYVGGVVGDNGGTVENCYNTGTVTGTDDYVGGVVGLNGSSVKNCYNTGSVIGLDSDSSSVGGVVGQNNNTVTGCYFLQTTGVNESLQGIGNDEAIGAIAESVNDLDTLCQKFTSDPWTISDTLKRPVLTSNHEDDGSKDHPYEIFTADQLENFRDLVNGEGEKSAHAKLMNNIDLKDVCGPELDAETSWTPIGNSEESAYIGTFNGNGHKIENLYINTTDSGADNQGLFGRLDQGGTVQNLSVSGTVNSSGDYVGGIVGYNSSGTVTNCAFSGSVSGSEYVGGVVGENSSGSVENCYNTGSGTVTGTDDYVGGVVGYNYSGGSVTNSYNTSSVKGDWYVGGVVGSNSFSATVTNCYNTGTVTGTGYFVGGVVGDNYLGASVENCYNTGSGTVTGTDDYVGGVVGYNISSTVKNCYNTGAVNSSGNRVGGVVGDNDEGHVTNCYNTGKVSGNRYVGGVVGLNLGNVINCAFSGSVTGSDHVGGVVGDNFGGVKNCYNTGTVTSSGTPVGGVVGYNDISGSVTNCYNTGTVTVTGTDDYLGGVGGVVGQNFGGTVENSYNTGTVTGTDDSVGGVVGWNSSSGTVTNCYNTGAVSGGVDVGGVVGWNSSSGTVTNCYNTGAVSDGVDVGGVVGYNYGGRVKNCYYQIDKGAIVGIGNETTADTSKAEGKTDAQFASGEVAYLLQSKQITPVWGQNIGEDKSPVLTSDQEKNVYKVTINLNDSDSTENETRYTNSDLQALTPTREGYTFDGWYDNQECTGERVTAITEDTTILYAKWIEATPEPTPDPDPEPEEPPYSGKYSYELTTSVGDHGALSVDRYATEGDKVTIEVAPDQAYKLDDLSVTAGGKEVALTAGGDGTFSFTMPSADVRITATFAEDPDWSEPEEPATDVSDIFIDIAPDAWYKDAVQYAYDNGLMTGVSDTEFAPEATTTRAMIVSILARLENVTTAQAAGFADVDDNDWYATAVNWAANVGVVNGYEDNTFRPNQPITREQLAAILMNYAAYKGEDVSARADLSAYTDQPSTWAEETMQWAVAEGLISGVTADTLQPQGAATRAQVAAILQRFLSE